MARERQSSLRPCSKWLDERKPDGPRTTATISQASMRIGAEPMIDEPADSLAVFSNDYWNAARASSDTKM